MPSRKNEKAGEYIYMPIYATTISMHRVSHLLRFKFLTTEIKMSYASSSVMRLDEFVFTRSQPSNCVK